jgi:hypothetical protein
MWACSYNFRKIQMPETTINNDNQVKSKKRVADHGEVFTNQREVNAMLDLVKHETETYLLVGPFESKNQCDNVVAYINSRFFHFMVTLQKNTQDCMKKVYFFVPIQDFSDDTTNGYITKCWSR